MPDEAVGGVAETTSTDTPENSGADLSDDEILADIAKSRQTKADDALLGDDEPKPKKGAKTPPPEEDDEEEADDADLDDEDDLDEEEESPQTQRSLQKARKLFDKGDVKGALKAALGLKDEDLEASDAWEDQKFVNAKFRAFRNKVSKTETAFKEREQKQIKREADFAAHITNNVAPKLRPGLEAMQMLQEYEKTGDNDVIVKFIEKYSKKPYDKFTKEVLKGTPPNVSERRLSAKIAELEAKLEKVGKPEPETDEQKRAKAQENLKAYLADIKEEIADHDVRKIPGAAKKVLAVLRKHYDPKLKAPRISVEKAADRVLKMHMRLVDRLAPKTAPEPTKKPTKVVAHSRATTLEAGIVDDDLDDDAILRQIEIERAKRRREEAKLLPKKAGKR